jgi:hypothetical protein
MLQVRFEKASRLGLNERRSAFELNKTLFRKPPQKGDQMSFF